MRYSVGIDLGTSFTSAAISGPNGTRMVQMSPSMTVPSVAYPAPGGSLLTGERALHAVSDPKLVARNFKRRLGDPTSLVLGGSGYSPAALMAAQLRDVLATVSTLVGGRPESVVLTHPAIWGPYRREHFTEVPRLAVVDDFSLITEPEAAATHYSSERRLGDGEVVAVYDLGGGTFDTTILRMRGGRMEILGTPEGIEHLGGIDFDEVLAAHIDQRLDGAVSELDAADPQAAVALAAIQAMCVRAKEDLSTEPDVRLSVPLPSGTRDVTITRLEFNEMIKPSVRLTIEALHRTTASAGLRVEDLSAVLLAGGSSRVPLVAQTVAAEFNKPVRATLHPKFTVALGAALVSARPRPAAPPPPAPAPAPSEPAPAEPASAEPTVVIEAPAPPPRRKWLVPTIGAASVLVVGAAVALFATAGSGAPSDPLPIYDGDPVAPFTGYVGSDSDGWNGTALEPGGTEQPPHITAEPDPNAAGLRVTWTDEEPAQFYLQTANPEAAIDLTSYAEHGGALVFDAVLHGPPTDGYTKLAVHCHFPCVAELPATDLFGDLPVGQPTTMKIPLSCFTSAGLDPKQVNTPFLVYSQRRMDITFSDIRVEPGAAEAPDATPCTELR
ncbi:Hsp70 family protein [Saccharopolyspora sp. NFXS83]|uniref:Hsp70 family protein n=1 Tax=Saccharopolyspora sp. NFXS83 TaxID=2993560 RepID=UPI00224A4B1F|nr:Hsp70 family protein [Saccharopolyspora sp. NFXS83]MCX2729505.1 Hsp70 family protein [Saccharopolyspora sp. NFXS83]